MSKIIPGAEAGWESWVLPEVQGGGAAGGGEDVHRLLTARQLEQIQKQAYEEGFAQGRREGMEAGRVEIQSRSDYLEQIMRSLDTPLKTLDRQVEQQLAALSMAVARHLVRRELKTDPGQVVAVVREAMAVGDAEPGWQITPDPVIARGGCRVTSDTSQVDATVETRLNEIIAAVLGGERDDDDPADV